MRRGIYLLMAGILFWLTTFSIWAQNAKEGMPDISQVDNTCVPSSLTNLMLWFGQNGYPRLIPTAESEEVSKTQLLHLLMMNVNSRFDRGTSAFTLTKGIAAYAHKCGYGCICTYHGLGSEEPFSQKWLDENSDPAKGFIILLNYVKYNSAENRILSFFPLGHAVTLVLAQPNLLLIHDPAHDPGQMGRKLLDLQTVNDVSLQDRNLGALTLISSHEMMTPPECQIIIIGAVEVHMFHSVQEENSGNPVKSAVVSVEQPASQGLISWLIHFLTH